MFDWFWIIRNRFRLYWKLVEKFDKIPRVGDYVCDCRYRHLKITKAIDADTVQLEDGSKCSLLNCCDPVNHEWEHPPDFVDLGGVHD